VTSAPLVAVTGAGGFIGTALCRRLVARRQPVRRLGHHATPGGDEIVVNLAHASVGDIARHLAGASALVHLAGRVHVMRDTVPDAEAAYKLANVDLTERLALGAVAAGVRRFVFASTVKVNGEVTRAGHPFRPGDAPAPQDAYAAASSRLSAR
jgi:nucleoside-diphosphate-sugar epimerase